MKTECGREICNSERPMPTPHTGRWVHEETEEIGEQEDGYPGGDIIKVRCKVCGTTWKEELPQ